VLFAMSYSLPFDSRGKACGNAMEIMAAIVAEMVLQHLEQSNYVIMQGPAAVAPSTPEKPKIAMKD
jgi:hypothetical protein